MTEENPTQIITEKETRVAITVFIDREEWYKVSRRLNASKTFEAIAKGLVVDKDPNLVKYIVWR